MKFRAGQVASDSMHEFFQDKLWEYLVKGAMSPIFEQF
jgi:hypothetical protein